MAINFHNLDVLRGGALKNAARSKIKQNTSAFNSLPSDFSNGSPVRQARQYRSGQNVKKPGPTSSQQSSTAQKDFLFERDFHATEARETFGAKRQQRAQSKQQKPLTARQQRIKEKGEASKARYAERQAQANDPRVQQSAFNRLPEGYGTASSKARTAQYSRGQSKNPVDQRRETSDAYENFSQQRQQSADQARTNYFNRLDEKKTNKQNRRREARQTKQEEKRSNLERVQGYKDQIAKSRAETAHREHVKVGNGRSGAGMTEDAQLSMMKEDMGIRFKANGGLGGVGRGAVQGAAMGGVVGGSIESMQGGDFWDGAKSGAMMGATGMAGLRAAKQATGAQSYFRGNNNIMGTYNRQTEQYGVGVKALMMNNEMASKAKSVMNWRKRDQ